MTTAIGFIGLGQMGLPMAANLTRNSEYKVFAYDLNTQPFETLSKCDAWGKTLFKAGNLDSIEGCEYVVLMLPNSNVTNLVVEGGKTTKGLIDILQPGAMVIDMGSSNPSETLRLSRLVGAARYSVCGCSGVWGGRQGRFGAAHNYGWL